MFVELEGAVAMITLIFEATDSDDEIAAVLSHQIAHFLAHHREEKLSGKLISRLAIFPAMTSVVPWLSIRKLASFAPLGLIVPSFALTNSLLLPDSSRG